MAEVSHEPSMEEILSSIKKIISEDSGKTLSVPRRARADAVPLSVADDVLELSERAEPEILTEAAPSPELIEPVAIAPLMSDGATTASRNAFASLQRISVTTERPPAAITGPSVDDLVREMLRPMLKDWLDTNLPAIVEGVVAKEVARISGR